MYEHYYKRFLDFTIALIAILCVSWLLAISFICLSIANKGAGAFFVQDRIGKGEKLFRIIKFKTMTDKKDASGMLMPDEQRITRIGRFMRSTSIDELPQLINVLKGEMSLIGPRPLLARYLPWYTAEERHRHDVRPGISGWAQCHGRNELSWDEKLAMDVWYVNNVSLQTDIEIILRTLKSVLKRESVVASGVESLDVYRMRIKK